MTNDSELVKMQKVLCFGIWYIEVYYKNHRLHESNDYETPHDYLKAT